jgi:hypothetical protein
MVVMMASGGLKCDAHAIDTLVEATVAIGGKLRHTATMDPLRPK